MLKADVDCLCEAFKSSAQFGVVWNITKAVALHTTCRVSSPSVSNYGRQSSHSSLSFSALFFFFFFFFFCFLENFVDRKISSFGISARNFFCCY